jgi:uncharacterized repeat protein (TIGR02543 family)
MAFYIIPFEVNMLKFSLVTSDDKPKYEPMWIEQYWWVIVLAVVSVAAIVFAILFFMNKKAKMIQVTVYTLGRRHEVYSIHKNSTYNPEPPEREGYEFRGWFMDSACSVPWLSTYTVKKAMCLYPKWEKV